MSQAAFAFLQNGQFARAEQVCRQLLAADADDSDAVLFLALSLQAQGRSQEAIPLLTRLAAAEPDVYEHWNNLGNALRDVRRFEDAAEAFEKALRLAGETPELLLNIGLSALDAGNPVEAQQALDRAVELEPGDPEIRTFCGVAAMHNNDLERAKTLVSNWREWREVEDTTLAEAAWLLFRAGLVGDAEEALALAARSAPDNPRVLVRQGAIHERSNRTEQAWAVVEELAQRHDLPATVAEDLALLRTALASRGKDLQEARRMHEALLVGPASMAGRFHLYFSLAKVCDGLGDSTAAMDALANAHRDQLDPLRKRAPHLFNGVRPPLTITRYRIGAEHYAQWPRDEAGVPAAASSPIFVVGFPRSGTTMLETMLDAHAGLACMDERPYLQHLVERIQSWNLRYPEDLGRLDAGQCETLRALYFDRAARHATLGEGMRLVDKNPLNMLKLPLIRRLWPHAKIVLALRHPADVVVSNHFQCYLSQVFAAMCESLESTARGYANAFDFWFDQRDVLGADVLELRYEDLVADLDAHARRLIEFLGLPWDDAVLSFHEHARKRGYISTPSYTQVIEPINARAVGRAQAYAAWLAPALPILRPYIARWGYRDLDAP